MEFCYSVEQCAAAAPRLDAMEARLLESTMSPQDGISEMVCELRGLLRRIHPLLVDQGQGDRCGLPQLLGALSHSCSAWLLSNKEPERRQGVAGGANHAEKETGAGRRVLSSKSSVFVLVVRVLRLLGHTLCIEGKYGDAMRANACALQIETVIFGARLPAGLLNADKSNEERMSLASLLAVVQGDESDLLVTEQDALMDGRGPGCDGDSCHVTGIWVRPRGEGTFEKDKKRADGWVYGDTEARGEGRAAQEAPDEQGSSNLAANDDDTESEEEAEEEDEVMVLGEWSEDQEQARSRCGGAAEGSSGAAERSRVGGAAEGSGGATERPRGGGAAESAWLLSDAQGVAQGAAPQVAQGCSEETSEGAAVATSFHMRGAAAASMHAHAGRPAARGEVRRQAREIGGSTFSSISRESSSGSRPRAMSVEDRGAGGAGALVSPRSLPSPRPAADDELATRDQVVWEGLLEVRRECVASSTQPGRCQHCSHSLGHGRQPTCRPGAHGGQRAPRVPPLQPPRCRVPLRATCEAKVRCGPANPRRWPAVVYLNPMAEATAQQALKDRPKESKISVVTLTGEAQVGALRTWLQAAKAAARVEGGACGDASLAYIFAWKDEILGKKRMPPGALVLFVVSLSGVTSYSALPGGGKRVADPRSQHLAPGAPPGVGG